MVSLTWMDEPEQALRAGEGQWKPDVLQSMGLVELGMTAVTGTELTEEVQPGLCTSKVQNSNMKH